MSLSSLLEKPEVRKWFKENIPKPKITLEGKLLARPRTKDYGIIGTAFDYLLRFRLERLNRDKTIACPWVAEWGVSFIRVTRHLTGECGLDALNERDRLLLANTVTWATETLDGNPTVLKLVETAYMYFESLRRVLRRAESLLKKAKSAHQRYIRSGRITENLLKGVFHLAQLDLLFRPGMLPRDFGSVKKGHIADLRKLLSIIPVDQFEAEKTCVLNPTFGRGSKLVGGADADFVIDDMLVDIKTTKHPKFTRAIYNQLWGYYMLSRIGRIVGPKRKPTIKRLGIYFARHAKLVTFDVNDILDAKARKRCIQSFKDKITRLYISGAW